MSKIKLDSEEFLRPVITYMLREFGVDYDYVVKHPKINGVLWCKYYWDTPESKKHFLDWLKKFLKTKVDYKPHKLEDVIVIWLYAGGLNSTKLSTCTKYY